MAPTREERLEAELEASDREVAALSARVRAGATESAALRAELAAAQSGIAQLAETLRHEQDQREALCESMRASQLDDDTERELAERERAHAAKERAQERRLLQGALEAARAELAAERRGAEEATAAVRSDAAAQAAELAETRGALEAARGALKAARGSMQRLQRREGVVRERVVACEAKLTRLRGCKLALRLQTAATEEAVRSLQALRTDHDRQLRDKDALIDGLKKEVDAAHDRFQQSVQSVELDMERQLHASKVKSTKLKVRCDYLARKVRSQDSVLHSLDCNLDRMIAADPV